MYSAVTESVTKGRLNISDLGPRFGSTKPATAAMRGALTLIVLSALILMAARPAQAQTETVLYNFTRGSDGGNPQSSLTSDGAGNFYGTTYYGGLACGESPYGCGTVFELSPNGSGGWNETVLYAFCSAPNCADGANPEFSSLIFDSLGNLYGTALLGGANGYGVVFELSPAGANWTESVLYSFANDGDGAYPAAGLIMDKAGNLYGTTEDGPHGTGNTVFEVSPSGGGWTEQTIYSGGFGSYAGLAMDAAGNLFGVTYSTVFELSPNGGGGWNPAVIHTFTGSPKDGTYAYGTLVLDKSGNLYGTTYFGGAKNYGTVYELSPRKKGKWTEKILHSFKSGKDGANPFAGIVFDSAGNIYGTTQGGGKFSAGTVFELVAPVGKGSYKEKVLWSFNGTDGNFPDGSPILDSAGNLYGTTDIGGSNGDGVVFEVTP